LKIQLNGMSGSNNPSNLSLSEGQSGTYTSNATTGVWEGNAQEVSFKINNQVRLYTIVVTLAGQEEPAYLRGDVNHDGFVTIGDVTDLIDYLLTDASLAPAEADFNNDGVVTIKDATDLIDYLLGGSTQGE
jgi:hypothetical protein